MARGQGGGRPRVSEATLKKFLKLIREGNSIRAAAGSSGMGASTYYKITREAEHDRADGKRTRFVKFMEQYEKARADAETDFAKIVGKSAKGDKKAGLPPNTADARFMLAHINRKRWGDRARIDFGGEPPIDRGELIRGVQELAKAVRDEVEDPLVLARIMERWQEVIEGWTSARSRTRRKEDGGLEVDGVVVEKPIAEIPATTGNGEGSEHES